MNKTIKYTLATSAVALLVACGGGGGGGEGGGDVANNPLAKYVGVYYSCEDNEKTTLTLNLTDSGSLSIALAEDVYSGDNCSGNIVGSYRWLTPARATYKGQTTVTMPPITLLPFSDKVDEVRASTAGITTELTGSGVVGNCVQYSYSTASGSTEGESCFELNYPSENVDIALYLTADGQYLVQFSRENGVLEADSIISKNSNFNYSMLMPD